MGGRGERRKNGPCWGPGSSSEGLYHYTFLLHNLNEVFIVFASLSWACENFSLRNRKLPQDLYCVAAGSILAMYEPVFLPSWIFYIQQ